MAHPQVTDDMRAHIAALRAAVEASGWADTTPEEDARWRAALVAVEKALTHPETIDWGPSDGHCPLCGDTLKNESERKFAGVVVADLAGALAPPPPPPVGGVVPSRRTANGRMPSIARSSSSRCRSRSAKTAA